MREAPIIRRYSEAFKQKLISEYECGKMSKLSLSRKYGITGGNTLNDWLKKYGKNELIGIKVKVTMKHEADELKRLKEENKKLKLTLADLTLENRLLQKEIEYRKTLMGDESDLKKKTKRE